MSSNELNSDTNEIPNGKESLQGCKKMNENVDVIIEKFPNNVFVNQSVMGFVSKVYFNRLIVQIKVKRNHFHSVD